MTRIAHTLSSDTALQLQRSSDALDCISEAYFALDREWRFTHVNARAQALFGCRREVLLGGALMEKIPDMGEGVFHQEFMRAMTGGEVRSFDACYPPLGAPQKVHVFPSEQGLAVFFRDVTQARVPEQRLLEERETLLAVVQSTDDAIISTDLGGRINMFNPGAERIFRRSHTSVLNQGMEMLMPERFRAAHAQDRHLFAQSTEPRRMMGLGLVKGLRSDGQEIELEGDITQVTVAQRQILIASLRDVTERMRGEAEVELSRQQLSDLTQRLMLQEKTLVKRVAQVLHDQLGQTIAAISVVHETLLTRQGAELPAPLEEVEVEVDVEYAGFVVESGGGAVGTRVTFNWKTVA